MKFGTGIDKYGYQFSKYFKTCQRFSLSSYATLNISQLHNITYPKNGYLYGDPLPSNVILSLMEVLGMW